MQIYHFKDIHEAKSVMEEIGAAGRGAEIMAEKAVFLPVRLEHVDTRAANILKQTILSQGGEAAVSAATVCLSQPYTDVLLLATAAQIRKALPRLREQPWGLKTVAEDLARLLQGIGITDV